MRTLALLLLLLAGPALGAAAVQDALDEAKAQYEAAAYEEALATLTRISDASASIDRVEVEQYRALCLIALGNMPDAERAVAALVAANPMYVPSESVASPRVLSLVADIRRKELPTAARRLLDAGRTAYQAKDLDLAKQHFELLLLILADPAMAGRPENDDLGALANGFVTLIAAAAAPPTPSPTPLNATNGATPVETNGSTETPPATDGEFYLPPVAIEQTLPEWEPPTVSIAKLEYVGRLRVQIGIDGKVTGAIVEEPSHAFYDRRLLEVARGWLYKPATRNGVPVESEKTIAIRLIPEP